MKVLICNPQPDCAGVGYGFAQAGRLAGHDVHHVAGGIDYLDYPQDWFWSGQEWRDFIPDLYMLTNGSRACVEKLGFIPRNAIVFYHGSDIRIGNKPTLRRDELADEQRWRRYASTIDLEWISGAQWLPPPIDLRVTAAPGERFTISHSPTNPKLKGTNAFFDACRIARERGCDFDIDFIAQETNTETLRRKALSHAHFDQLYYGYGMNAVEAMAMGVPVITGARNPDIAAYYHYRLKEVPYLDAHPDESQIAEHIVALIEDPELGREYAVRGKRYVKSYHAPEVVAKNLDRVWSC